MSIQRHFDLQLAELKETLLAMAAQAQEGLGWAMKAYRTRDLQLAQRVKAGDTILDHFEKLIDQKAIELLALKAPVASDLRLIAIAMKISHDLERVGDESSKIARRCLKLQSEWAFSAWLPLEKMGLIAGGMLNDAIDSFVTRNPSKARAIIPRDKEVDELNKQFHAEIVAQISADPARLSDGLHLMVICKCLERIADHATNIAEEVVYLCEAKDIRHQQEV